MRRNSRRIWTTPLAKVAIAVLVGAALTGCGGDEEGAGGDSLASYSRGFSVVLTEQFADDGGAGDVSVKNYSDLQQLYTDLLSGRADMTIGGPDVFALQAQRGAPVHLAATISPNSTAIVGKTPLETEADLKGKRVTAIASSGGWHLAEAAIKREFGLTAGDDYELVNVPDMASGASQVVAGTADFVVGWEPSVNAALEASKELMISYSVADAAEGETFGSGWQLVLAARDDVDPETEQAVIEALQKAAEKLQGSPADADAYGVEFGFEPGTVSGVMGQSVQPFVIEPIDDETQNELQEQLSLIEGDDGPLEPPASFYGGDE